MWLYLDFKGQWMCYLGSMAVFSFLVLHRFLSRQINVPTVNPGAPPTVKTLRDQKVGLQLAVIYTVTVFFLKAPLTDRKPHACSLRTPLNVKNLLGQQTPEQRSAPTDGWKHLTSVLCNGFRVELNVLQYVKRLWRLCLIPASVVLFAQG